MLALTSLSLTSLATMLPHARFYHAVLARLRTKQSLIKGTVLPSYQGACLCQEGANWRQLTNKLIKLGKIHIGSLPSRGGRSDKRAAKSDRASRAPGDPSAECASAPAGCFLPGKP